MPHYRCINIAWPLDMTNLHPFVYDTLSAREIRLLTPGASVSGPGLSWTITNVNIDDLDQSFIALSYAWAARFHSAIFPISCNGRQLWVHHNLYSALPFLARHIEANRLWGVAYWIDAICINQNDDAEKTSQIRLMNTIYRKAGKVLVWLGLALKPEWQELIPRAIELLPLLVEEYARHQRWSLDTNVVVDRKLSHLGRDVWEAIMHLLRNPYFRRLWIIQEVALAKEITFLCGDHELDPYLLEQAVLGSWLIKNWVLFDLDSSERMRVHIPFHDDSIVFKIRRIINYSGDEGNAHQTIRIANLLDDQICSAPQDRVLGILGMVEQEFGNASQALNGSKSIAELYTQFNTLIFEASGLTKTHWWFYLSMAFNKTRIDGLPSWVPDLHNNDAASKRQPYESMLAAQGSNNPPWQASSKPRRAAYGPRFGEIVLRGKLLDVVTFVHPEVPFFPDPLPAAPGSTEGMTWMAILVDLIKWETKLADTVIFNATPETRVSEDTYWRTLLADIHSDITSSAQSTYETWLRFREMGQRFLRLVPRLEELSRYITTLFASAPDFSLTSLPEQPVQTPGTFLAVPSQMKRERPWTVFVTLEALYSSLWRSFASLAITR
jgi:hypothetical protein